MVRRNGAHRHSKGRRQLAKVSKGRLMCFMSVLSFGYLWLTLSWTPTLETTPSSDPIHDPSYLRSHLAPFSSNFTGVCDTPPGEGEEGPAGIRGLYKVKTADLVTAPTSRLFCMVYTHSNRHDVLRSIAETYAPSCDGFMAASNLTVPSLGAFDLPHVGPESYDNMWNKVRAMWFYVHQNYLMDYDWFHIGGDDMYVIPENLKLLTSKYPQRYPWYLGSSIPNSKNPSRRFCGGGAGYTLNRHAVHLLVRRLASGECPADVASDEDVRVGRCLEDAGVKCLDTNDDSVEVRYHHLDVQYHASWVPTKKALWLWQKLDYFHGIRGNQSKLAQISNTSVTFHLDKGTVRSRARDRGIRRYHAILEDLCGSEFSNAVEQAATCSKECRDQLQRQWEQTPKAANVIE